MKKKDVIISFKGVQGNGRDKEVIELVTPGKYYKEGDAYCVTYSESELTGMEGTTTTLIISGNKVTMLRFGENNTQLIFEKGQNHLCCYETEFGEFMVGVRSKNVNVDVNENGGEISADYQIEIDNAAIGVNNFHMQIRECQ